MITVRNDENTSDIYLSRVDHYTTSADASRHLWTSVHNASKIYGGEAALRTPEDGEWGFLVTWVSGPKDWATAYVVSEGADAPGFTASTDDGMSVRYVDLD